MIRNRFYLLHEIELRIKVSPDQLVDFRLKSA